jgi:putative YphP/YqiW family bacilliredoxin
MALFLDGKPVYMLHRHEIERREPAEIAAVLAEVFDEYCVTSKRA